jgi:hypothetical protein
MRTRLDEIVEEETREACPGAGAPRGGYLHRIHRHRCPYCKNRTYVDPHPADSQGE